MNGDPQDRRFTIKPSEGADGIWSVLDAEDTAFDTFGWCLCFTEERAQLIADLLEGERPFMNALTTLRLMGNLTPKQRDEILRITGVL